MKKRIRTSPNPQLAVDRVEINVLGKWEYKSWQRLMGLEYRKHHDLCGESMLKKDGGRHGPDFYPYKLLSEKQFRIDIFSRSDSQFAARCYLYGERLTELGLAHSFSHLRRFVTQLGCDWISDQVSRIDLRRDITVPFNEFRQRIESGCFVTRMKPGLPKRKQYATTRYFGRKDYLQVCIYDKAEQLGIAGPLTRVEFRASRKYLRGLQVTSMSSLNVQELWQTVNTKIRLTNRRPDKTHQSRFTSWHVWETIQRSRWGRRDAFPKESSSGDGSRACDI